MKDGFIRIKDNNDIFYDSIEKVYRYRMHCPECEKLIPTCRCYHDLDCLLIDIEEGIADYTCSAKCCLVGGDWDELGEAMQEIGLEKDLKECLKLLTETQSAEAFNELNINCVLKTLFEQSSQFTFSQIKDPSHEDRLEIIFIMGDVKTHLKEYDIDYYPDCKDLTEEQAQELLDFLTDGGEFDYPSGEECEV